MAWIVHDNDIVHCDLTSVSVIHPVHRDPLNIICKQNNVLIAADGSPRLADFGISNVIGPPDQEFPPRHSLIRCMAPELLANTNDMTLLEEILLLEKETLLPEEETLLSKKATLLRNIKSGDIYSLGCIILEVMSLIDLLTLIDAACRFYMGKCPIGGSSILNMFLMQSLIKRNPSELIPPFRSSIITSIS